MASGTVTARVILRSVLIVVAVVLVLYVIYLLRRPITWLIVAAFIAVALAGPVRLLERRIPRGLAIAIVYLLLVLIPVVLGSLLIPPIVEQGNTLVNKAPQYSRDVSKFITENDTLRGLERDYNITGKLQEEAGKLPGRIGDAAGVLQDIGVGVVNSIFAGFTILILSVFMLASGRGWIDRAIDLQPPARRERMHRVLERTGKAVTSYVGGALLQATIAGVTTLIVLEILGVPFAAPLAVLVFFFDLIPVVGATLGAILVGIVTLFVDFPVATIVWIVYALVYQQVENYLIQPQIQKRAVAVQPFVVLVAVLFGSTLFGVLGAVLAIPVAASIQIAVSEWFAWRREQEPTGAVTLDPPSAGA